MTSTMATIKDCTCPICLCILIEPVTMPCGHSICLPCYRQTVEKANLCCPLCRLRISVWARRSAKAGTLIDGAKWGAIKKAFPEQVQKRLEGKEMLDDDDDSESYETRLRQLMALSKPGEIREEYEAELRKLQDRRQEEAKVEEEASAALIRSLQQEEEKEKEALERLKEEQDRLDREIAEQLQETFVSEDDEDKLVAPEAWTTPVTMSERSNKSMNKKTGSKTQTGKCKQIKPASSNNLTMATFFSPVARATGVTSPDCGQMAARKLNVDSCGDADLASYHFLHDADSLEDSSHTPASKGFFSSKIQLLRHQHPSEGKPVKTAAGNLLLEDSAAGGGVASRTNLNLETSDRFAAGPSGLGRCGTVISAAFPDVRTHIPANIACEIPDGKHPRNRQHLQPLEIPSRISTQLSSYSANEPSGRSAAAGKYESVGMTSSKTGSLESSSLNTGPETVSCSSQLQIQPARMSDAGERCSSNEKASALSHRQNSENFRPALVESSMSSGDGELESQPRLFADLEKTASSCKDPTQATRDKVKLAVNPASLPSLFHRPDSQLAESGDGVKRKCNDTVHDFTRADDLCANYDNSCASSCHNDTANSDSDDTTQVDSDDTTNSDVEDTKSYSDTCIEFSEGQVPSRQQSAYLSSLEKHPKISNVKSKCNSEKENRLGIDYKQYVDVKTNSKIEDRHHMLNPTVTVFRVKRNSAKKSKNSRILSPKGKKLQPVVSIMRWCVPNGCQGESKNGLQTKNNTIVHETDSRHTNSPDVLNHFGKRKHAELDNDQENNIFDGGKQTNNIHNDNRKEMLAAENDVFVSKKKKMLKDDSAIDSSTENDVFVSKKKKMLKDDSAIDSSTENDVFVCKKKKMLKDDSAIDSSTENDVFVCKKKKMLKDDSAIDSSTENDVFVCKKQKMLKDDSAIDSSTENDVFFSKKQMLKGDSSMGSSSSVWPETSEIDVVDLDGDAIDQSGMSREELDHLMAVRLQDMYSRLDQKKISVDRFRGSEGQYMFRKKSARK